MCEKQDTDLAFCSHIFQTAAYTMTPIPNIAETMYKSENAGLVSAKASYSIKNLTIHEIASIAFKSVDEITETVQTGSRVS